MFSLSIGGCIFLCTTYMVENLKIHAELSLKSEDCILRSPADSDAFQSGRYADHNGRPESLVIMD